MNVDARINVDLPSHPKTLQLERALGPEGFRGLICVLLWAAKHRSSGDLSGLDDVDLEGAVGWRGRAGLLMGTLVEVGFVDGGERARRVHGWAEHNPWAADARNRSFLGKLAAYTKRMPRAMALKRLEKEGFTDVVQTLLRRRHGRAAGRAATERATHTPSPSPSPSDKATPTHIPEAAPRAAPAKAAPKAGSSPADDGFAEFYAAFPRQVAKADALKAWRQTAPKRPALPALLAAVAWQRVSGCLKPAQDREGRSTVPYPASWLRGERWDDVKPNGSGGAALAAAPVDPAEAARRLRAQSAQLQWGELLTAAKLRQKAPSRLDAAGLAALADIGGFEGFCAMPMRKQQEIAPKFAAAYIAHLGSAMREPGADDE